MKLLALFAITVTLASAQVYTDFSTSTASSNLYGAMNSKTNGTLAASAPGTCTDGKDIWWNSSTGALSYCHPANTWVALSSPAAQAANTINGNYTSGSATPTAGAAPTGGTSGCSGTSDAAIYTVNVGWGCHQITGTGNTTIPDLYWPFGGQSAAANNTGFSPGLQVQRVFTFTVPPGQIWSFGHFRTIAQGISSLYIAAAITNYAGTSIQTNSASTCLNNVGAGNGLECAFAGTVTLNPGTYRWVMTADAAAGWYTQGGVMGTLGWNNGTNSGFPLASSVAVGTATNAATGVGVTLAVAVPLGTINPESASIAKNDFPVLVLNP